MNNSAQRREMLKSAIGVLATAAVGGSRVARATERERRSPFGRPLKSMPQPGELTHLLNRISFGIKADELAMAESMGYEAYVDYQLDHNAIDDSELDQLLAESVPTIYYDTDELMQLARDGDGFIAARDLTAATLARALLSRRQLNEMLVAFWSNHFNVDISDGPVQFLKTYEDREIIRPNVLGSFRDLLHADARSPAMMAYLDNFSNTVDGPNENYARELMELHTLGVDGGYTEIDVVEVARCFTGWGLNEFASDLFAFYPGAHDYEAKTVLGQNIAEGQGIEDGEQVLDLLAAHDSTVTFLCTKLATRFVADQPPQSLIDLLADTFVGTAGDLREVTRTLLLSQEFKASADQKFKQPWEYLTSVLRTTNAVTLNNAYRFSNEFLASLGQAVFRWPTPDGYPDNADYWINSAAILNRWNYGIGTADGVHAETLQVSIYDLLGEARSPGTIVDTLIEGLLHREIESNDRKILVDFVAEGKPENAKLPLSTVVPVARGVLGLIVGSRYFQVR